MASGAPSFGGGSGGGGHGHAHGSDDDDDDDSESQGDRGENWYAGGERRYARGDTSLICTLMRIQP